MIFSRLDDVSLYGVFDGHDSARASNFAAQRMPAELLLGQLNGKTTDEEIREVLYQVYGVPYVIIEDLTWVFMYYLIY